MEEDGHLEIRLHELMEKKDLIKNKLYRKAEMNWPYIDNYCSNEITQLEIYVLCEFYTVLECVYRICWFCIHLKNRNDSKGLLI